VREADWAFLFEIAMGICAISVAVRRKPIQTGPPNPKPFPHQRFARAAFYAVGTVMVLGGFWSLWLVRHAPQHEPFRLALPAHRTSGGWPVPAC
jgi:hypothetical protein